MQLASDVAILANVHIISGKGRGVKSKKVYLIKVIMALLR